MAAEQRDMQILSFDCRAGLLLRNSAHAKCHKDGNHRQSAAMTKNRGQDQQNGKNNGQWQARRQAEIAKGEKNKKEDGAMKQKATTRRSKIPKKTRQQKTTGKKHEKNAKSKHHKNTKKNQTIAIARTSSVAQKIS